MLWRMTWQEGLAKRCADGQISRLRMSPPICGGILSGRARHRPTCGNPLKGSTTVMWKTLKSIREELSEQVKRLQQQLSTGLQAVRRAASEECYPPRVQTTEGIPFPDSPRSHLCKFVDRCPMTPVGGHLPILPGRSSSARPMQILADSQMTPHTSPSFASRHGEGDPKKPYFREGALRYPLSMEAHDTGFRDLFYLMVLAKSLGLRPGDEVLDFGAGSCYVSELLNRFGYITVALDNDPEVLAIGHERLTLTPGVTASAPDLPQETGCACRFEMPALMGSSA